VCGEEGEGGEGQGVGLIQTKPTRVVSHYGFAIYIKKLSQGKRRIMTTQIFHHAKV
jgi:hypothetical protein